MSCPIHHQITKIAESKEELSYLAQKYKAKKKAYKESLKKLRNELKELRDIQYNQEMNMSSLRNKYDHDFKLWDYKVQYLRNMLPNRVQMPNTFEEFRDEENGQFEIIRKQKQHIDELGEENENLKNANYQLHIDNAKLNALLHGKTQECEALIEELGHLSQRRY